MPMKASDAQLRQKGVQKDSMWIVKLTLNRPYTIIVLALLIIIVDYCAENCIAFLPWAPLGQGRKADDAIEIVVRELKATPLQVALAWLLKRSKVILPIPGTSSVARLEKKVAAAGLQLPQAAYDNLSAVSHPPASLRG